MFYSAKTVGDKQCQATFTVHRKSAEQGNVPGLWKMGVCYYVGYEVPQDYKQAICWYRKAAEQGNNFSQYIQRKREKNGREKARIGLGSFPYSAFSVLCK